MKNKLNKILLAFLSVFLIFGGVIFSACGNEVKKATISVSSQDFVAQDYIEIDIGSAKTSAQIIATVQGVDSGRVTVNNDYQSIVSTSPIYNASSNSTTINISAVSEGKASIMLLSEEGEGQKMIDVFVYSDILSLEQKQDDGAITQYIVKGEPTILETDRFLNMTSREGGESNRKDVRWSLITQDDDITLENNILTVSDNYDGEAQIELRADSVYTDLYTNVVLQVISPLPDISSSYSRNSDSDYNIFENNDISFNLVKNDDSNVDSKLFIKLSVPVDNALTVTPIVMNNGIANSELLDITKFNESQNDGNTVIIYQIKTKNHNVSAEKVSVYFDVAYSQFDYKKESAHFVVNIVDVINKIEVSSDGEIITQNEIVNIYDSYDNDSSTQFGKPFFIALGPDSVSNDNSKFYISLNLTQDIPVTNYLRFYDERGQEISFNKVDQQINNGYYNYVSDLINNKSTIYIIASSNFTNGEEIECSFISQQSPKNVFIDMVLKCFKSPKSDFSIGDGYEYFLSTLTLNSIDISLNASSLIGITEGIKPDVSNNPDMQVSDFVFDSLTGDISFKVSNVNTNVYNSKIEIMIIHENGFKSYESITVEAFIPITQASVSFQGQSTDSVSYSSYCYQNYPSEIGITNSSLESLIMKFGSSITLNVSSNFALSSSFKFVENIPGYDDLSSNSALWPENLTEILLNLDDSYFSKDIIFDYYTGRLTLPSRAFKGLAFVTFTGYDQSHELVNIYRIFYLESYIAPSRLTSNPTNLSLIAQDSVSMFESELGKDSLRIEFRLDGNSITYYDQSMVKIYSLNDYLTTKNKTSLLNRDNYYYHIENLNIDGDSITFDVIADTTDGYSNLVDQIVVEYTVFNTTYPKEIDILIKNAQRVENIIWDNTTSDGTIYLDLYGDSINEKTFSLISTIQPSQAYNQSLYYTFVADVGTSSDLVSINDLGIVSFDDKAIKGGTGYIYILPRDAIRNDQGTEAIYYYVDVNGVRQQKTCSLSSISKNYDELVSTAYYYKRDGENTVKVYYSDLILKIKVTVADGLSEATATRIYNAEQFADIDPQKHYILMSSITLNDWISFGDDLSGSLKGYDQNITITLFGQPIFSAISSSGKVENLNFVGSVNGSDQNGGGFVAVINNGLINNVNVQVYNDGTIIKVSEINSAYNDGVLLYAGAVVAINNNLISNVSVEGVNILLDKDTNSFVGGVAGKNTGNIEYAKVEFYVVADDGVAQQSNRFVGNYVGAIVGRSEDGYIENSYAYNYSSAQPIDANFAGAFVGFSSYTQIKTSFALVGVDRISGSGLVDREDIYYTIDRLENEIYQDSNWVMPGDPDFKEYVRNGNPHLKIYQPQSVADLTNISIINSDKAIKVNDSNGIIYYYSLQSSLNLSEREQTDLQNLNTVLLSELLGEGADTLIAVSSDSKIAQIIGNSIIVKGIGTFDLVISSKQNHTLSRTFTFKTLYVISDFNITHNGIITSGFDIQEGKTDSVIFNLKNSVYLGNNPEAFKLNQNPISIETSVADSNLDGYVNFVANGLVGSLTVGKGVKDLLDNNNEDSFIVSANVSVNNLEDFYNNVIKTNYVKSLDIRPFEGANKIYVNNDSLKIDPSTYGNLQVVLNTDSDADHILISIERNGIALSQSQDNDLYSVFSFGEEDIFKVYLSSKDYSNSQIEYSITILINETYKSKINENENYKVYISSSSGTAENEPVVVDLTLVKQEINYIDVANYELKETNYVNGKVVYSRTDTAISVLSPGRSSIMNVIIDPTYAYYEYMTLTYENIDGAVLGITKLDQNSDYKYSVDYSSEVTQITNGLKITRNESGVFSFKIYVAGNISSDTKFNIIASFKDANGMNVITPANYELYVSYLPEAEITINGDKTAVVAKGGSLKLQVLLKSDQKIETLVPTGAKGISFDAERNWIETDNGNGTKTISINLYASLDAGVLVDGQYVNGEFEIVSTVSRIFNGVREAKTSKAYVTIVDFWPTQANIYGSVYDEIRGIEVFDSYIGISNLIDIDYSFLPESYAYDMSNQNQIEMVKNLLKARSDFNKNNYYQDVNNSGFSINYDAEEGKIIPIYERLYIGDQKLKFTENDNTWVYSNSKFRLSYNEGTGLSVLGLVSTSEPVVITLKDEIKLKSAGKNITYTIESDFGINVIVYSDQDLPLMIENEEDFLQVANEGTAQNYILMNDITLRNYKPISAAMFKSLDGNGYNINIESFNLAGSGTLNLALFTDIPSSSLIKNLNVNYYNGGDIVVDTTSAGYSNINVAGLAINNSGTITNVNIVAFANKDADKVNNGDLGIKVKLVRGSTNYYIDENSSVQSRIAGFVISNSGSITNSKVGGDEIIVIGEQIADNYTSYTVSQLSTFVLFGQGNIAGFVLENSGDIASSGVSRIQITNDSTSTAFKTSGFAGANNGNIRVSYVEGVENEDDGSGMVDNYHLKGSNISSKGVVSGFVAENRTNGVISDCYSNIFISSENEQKSKTSAGFVYSNEGKISKSYSASLVEKSNLTQINFSGVDSNGNSLNVGKIELCYYYIKDYDGDYVSDVQNSVSNQATLVYREEVENVDSYYGFIFNSSEDTSNGIWRMVENKGVELICSNLVTLSHRYYVPISADEYALPYAILENPNDSSMPKYNTAYGNEVNPILITSASDFKEAMGESKSTYISRFFNDTEIFGAYRFVADIDLSILNNELGNADIKSVDKIFSGFIDGNGFSISNISLKSSNESVGLFSEIDNGFVQNIKLEIDNITASNSYVVGSLAGIVSDSYIINVEVSQKVVTGSSSGKGVLGKNLTGGIFGAVFGETYLTGLTANDIIVQSSYYSDSVSDSVYGYYRKFNPVDVRKNERQNRSIFFSSDDEGGGVGTLSFAGGIVGYLDTYNSLEINHTGFIYNEALSSSNDYLTKKVLVSGSIDIRGEVVGGVFGYTGYQTKAQDIGIVLTKTESSYNKILSYNFYAGGIAGFANGQFYQIYAEHDQKTQDLIESSTSKYYKSGDSTAERGILDLFKYSGSTSATYSYDPISVGGLMGVVSSASIEVAYSKLNAINYTLDNTSSTQDDLSPVAGGIAGTVIAGDEYLKTISSAGATQPTTLYLNEVYTTSDVYAEKYFGGIFGRLKGNVKLTLASVNAVNHYGILNEFYTNNKVIYTIGDGASEDNVVVFPASIAKAGIDESDQTQLGAVKSFGYMQTYTSGDITVTVKPYYDEDEDFTKPKDYYFKISSVSNFTSPSNGYTETNGAFINSKGWSSDNWIHLSTSLYPSINFINMNYYVYLDQYNVDSVVARMTNSSIEVRVRGETAVGSNIYDNVDLSGKQIIGFSGRIVGGSFGVEWGDNFGPIESNDFFGQSQFPGIIINGTLFTSTRASARFINLNVIVKSEGDSDKLSVNSGLLVGSEVTDAKFDVVNLYLHNKITIIAENGSAGLFAPSAVNSSITNSAIYLKDGVVSGSGGAFVTIETPNSTADNPNSTASELNAGLFAGKIVQASKYETIKVQNNFISHKNFGSNELALNVENHKKETYINAGLYVGLIGNLGSDGTSSLSVAGINVSVRASESLPNSEGETEHNSGISVSNMAGSGVKGLSLGGYFGAITASNTSLSIVKTKDIKQTLLINVAVDVDESVSADIGGIVGEISSLQELTLVSDIDSTDKGYINTKFNVTKSLGNVNLGGLFGSVSGSFNIYESYGKISTQIVTAETAAISGNVGGVAGLNKATVSISDLKLSVCSATKKTLSKNAFTWDTSNDNRDNFIKTGTGLNFGGIFGQNAGSVYLKKEENKEIFVNRDNEDGEIIICGSNSKETVRYGDIIGLQTGTLKVDKFHANSITQISGIDTLYIGGLVGDADVVESAITVGGDSGDNVGDNSGDDLEISNLSNYFINATKVSAGGIVGKLEVKNDDTISNTISNTGTEDSNTISNTLFGGAFKFTVNSNDGTHKVGGIIGYVGYVSNSLKISNTYNYGDAIYTYVDNDTLSSYKFGGLIGYVSFESEDATCDKIEATGNVIAFTNNNPRLAGKAEAGDSMSDAAVDSMSDAIVGNGAKILTDGDGKNYYSSQVVLAVDNANCENVFDVGYAKNSAKGYNNNRSGETNIRGLFEGKGKFNPGSKLKPIGISDNGGEGTGTISDNGGEGTGTISDNEDGTNGIVYYTGEYPDTEKYPELYDNPFAFIGDFEVQEKSITKISKNGFISGVVVNNNFSDTTDTYNEANNVGGVVNELTGGIVFACTSKGTLSVGGNGSKNIGGIVGLMQGGLVAESYSAVNIVYRAGKGDSELGIASGIATTTGSIATTTGNNEQQVKNYFDRTYSIGAVESYISADLYAFTNGVSSVVRDSYTISRVVLNDYTIADDASGIRGDYGDDATKQGVYYDDNATELGKRATLIPLEYNEKPENTTGYSAWTWNCDHNYGYPYRNFGAFVYKTTIEDPTTKQTYYLIPNATKLNQIDNGNRNYRLVQDIDLSLTGLLNASTNESTDASTNESTDASTGNRTANEFDGNGKTINGLGVRLLDSVATIKNLRITDCVVTSNAVVAGELTGSAENVIATGTLQYNTSNTSTSIATGTLTDDSKSTSVGGLFATASGSGIENCKNYVKIDVDSANTDFVGGIVGKTTCKVSSCFNYAPINVNVVGSKVGGIVGSTSAEISKCGNENTVFNGYESNKTGGNYYAGGIAGESSVDESSVVVSNCYNTSMIKAGNSGINANGEGVAYAAGILASGTGTVTNCYNTGYIEALGSTANILNYFTKPNSYNDNSENFKATISYKCEKGNIEAYAIGKNFEGNYNSGTIFKNGIITGEFEWDIESSFNDNSDGEIPGTSNRAKFYKMKVSISSTYELYWASLDYMGAPLQIGIAETRTLTYSSRKYPNLTNSNEEIKTERTQTRFLETQTLDEPYFQKAFSTGTSSSDITSEILANLVSNNDDTKETANNGATEIKIAGNVYAFVQDEEQFKDVVSALRHEVSGGTFAGEIGGKSIEALYNAGYSFSVVISSDAPCSDFTGEARYNNGGLDITFYYSGYLNKNITTVGYKIQASKDDETQTVTLDSSNLFEENGEIIIKPGKDLVDGKTFTVSINGKGYNFTYKTDKGGLVYTDDEKLIVNNLDGQKASINLNEGKYISEIIDVAIEPKYIYNLFDNRDIQVEISSQLENPKTIRRNFLQTTYDGEYILSSSYDTNYQSTEDQKLVYREITQEIKGKIKSISFSGDVCDEVGLNDKEFELTYDNIENPTEIFISKRPWIQTTDTDDYWMLYVGSQYNEDNGTTKICYKIEFTGTNAQDNYEYFLLSSLLKSWYIYYNFAEEFYTNTGNKIISSEDNSIEMTYKFDKISSNTQYTDFTNAEGETCGTLGFPVATYKLSKIVVDNSDDTDKKDLFISYGSEEVKGTVDEGAGKVIFENLDEIKETQVKLYSKRRETKFTASVSQSIDQENSSASIIELNPEWWLNVGPYTVSSDSEDRTINFNGTNYTVSSIEVDDNGNPTLKLLSHDNETITSENGYIMIDGINYLLSITYDSASAEYNLVLSKTFTGTDGKLVLDEGKTVFYLVSENGELVYYDENLQPYSSTQDSDGNFKITIDGKDYLPFYQEKIVKIDGVTDENGKILDNLLDYSENGKVSYTGSLGWNQFVRFELATALESDDYKFSLSHNTLDLTVYQEADADKTSVYVNGALTEIDINDTESIGPFEDDKIVEFVHEYSKSSEVTSAEITLSEDDGKTMYSGLVLTNDINLGGLNEDYGYALSILLTSKNQNVINYLTSNGGLFTSGSGSIKNTSFAGSVTVYVNDHYYSGLIFAQATEKNKLNGVQTYGTIYTTSGTEGLKAGGMIGSASGMVTLKDSKNFVSFSNAEYSNNMAGMVWNGKVTLKGSLTNYGTIIGIRGSDGSGYNEETGEGNKGEKGQDVYVITAGLVLKDETPTLSNEGLVKAGDGGNGARGKDGKGGADSTSSKIAPTNGITGGAGGSVGECGTVYLSNGKNADKKTYLPSSSGAKGPQGNDGWGGLNLNLIQIETGEDKYSDTDRLQMATATYRNGNRDGEVSKIDVGLLLTKGSAVKPQKFRKNSHESLFWIESGIDTMVSPPDGVYQDLYNSEDNLVYYLYLDFYAYSGNLYWDLNVRVKLHLSFCQCYAYVVGGITSAVINNYNSISQAPVVTEDQTVNEAA